MRLKVYVVIGYLPADFGPIEAALASRYPNATYKARDGIWFLRSPESTSKEVSDRLGFVPDTASALGSGVVIGMNGYFGRWLPDLWEWLSSQPEMKNG